MKNPTLSEVCKDFVGLFYPRYCYGCSNTLMRGEDMVCTSCMLEMPQTNHHLDQNNSLKNRLAGRMRLSFALAFLNFRKSGRVQQFLHALKYRNAPEIAVHFGKVYGEKLREVNMQTSFDIILPVPLHPSKKRKRGYNQSAKFAEGLAEKLNVPFDESLLVRNVSTSTQTRKSRLTRWQNVNDIFSVRSASHLDAKRILLVDDVITTGATIEACYNAVVSQRCSEVSIACIAEA